MLNVWDSVFLCVCRGLLLVCVSTHVCVCVCVCVWDGYNLLRTPPIQCGECCLSARHRTIHNRRDYISIYVGTLYPISTSAQQLRYCVRLSQS